MGPPMPQHWGVGEYDDGILLTLFTASRANLPELDLGLRWLVLSPSSTLLLQGFFFFLESCITGGWFGQRKTGLTLHSYTEETMCLCSKEQWECQSLRLCNAYYVPASVLSILHKLAHLILINETVRNALLLFPS